MSIETNNTERVSLDEAQFVPMAESASLYNINESAEAVDDPATEPVEEPATEPTPETENPPEATEQEAAVETAEQVNSNEQTPETTEKEKQVDDWMDILKTKPKEEILKQLGDKTEILKALGVSDFLIQLDEHYNKTGNVSKYLSAATKDYSQMSDDEVIKEAISAQHPGIPDKVLNTLYKKEIEAYQTDPEEDDEEVVETNNYLKKVHADKYRTQLAEEQKKFLIPENLPEAKLDEDTQKELDEYRTYKEGLDKRMAEADSNLKSIENDPETKRLLSEKILSIGGEADYKFEVSDADELKQMATGEKNFYKLFMNENGSFNMRKWYTVAAHAVNPELFEKSLIEYGKTLAHKEQIEKDENPPERNPRPANTTGKKPLNEIPAAGWVSVR